MGSYSKNNKRSFLQPLLQAIGIIFTSITSFIGMLFWLKGDLLLSGLVTVLLITLLYFCVQLLIRNKRTMSKNPLGRLKFILWGFYLFLAIPISALLLHCMNVELNAKDEIRNLASIKMKSLDQMVRSYDSASNEYLSSTTAQLRDKIRRYLLAYGGRDAVTMNTLKQEMMGVPFQLTDGQVTSLVTSNPVTLVDNFIAAKQEIFQRPSVEIKRATEEFNREYAGAFDTWTRRNLNYAFYRLDNLLEQNLKILQGQYKVGTHHALQFKFSYPNTSSAMDKPLVMWQQHSPYFLLILALLMHLILLLPFFMEDAGQYASATGPFITSRNESGASKGPRKL